MKKQTSRPYNSASGFRLTRAAARKINAVEGIDRDGRVTRQLEEFDRQGLTQEQRRAAIRAKYTSPAK